MIDDQIQQQLIKAIRLDRSLPEEERALLLQKFQSSNEMNKLLAGVGGGAFGALVARYLDMAPTTQILMALAGFGIGGILNNQIEKPNDPNRVMQYNNKLKVYELQDQHK